ncbi:hypothetical protein [Paenibacillus gansuensis]|uniref:Antibiotic biosynthesis monooxygenase n=1 Tax=Paenibacillus gansuensis TaxID=306542 RepID=A0ABW5PEB5_9BACL
MSAITMMVILRAKNGKEPAYRQSIEPLLETREVHRLRKLDL